MGDIDFTEDKPRPIEKKNLLFFVAESMSELHQQLLNYQTQFGFRFVSLSIQQDGGKFCCLALTSRGA